MKLAKSQLSLKGRALRLLSGREYSRQELERRLVTYEEVPGELAKILDELQDKGFISEARVVESVINRRSAKLGASRIRQELQSKGLDRNVVTEAVAGLQSTELARARLLWEKKFTNKASGSADPGKTGKTGKPGKPADRAAIASERGKQIRYLASRGFSGDTIRRVLAGPTDQDVYED